MHACDAAASTQPGPGVLVLGAVVLCVTGGEALYADLGHFGRAPITLAWYTVVFPALLLSYFGQGAFLLRTGAEGVDNPFFALLPTLGRAADGRDRDPGHDRGLAGGDLGLVLAHGPGDPARLPAAHADRAHVEPPGGPDLHARR